MRAHAFEVAVIALVAAILLVLLFGVQVHLGTGPCSPGLMNVDGSPPVPSCPDPIWIEVR